MITVELTGCKLFGKETTIISDHMRFIKNESITIPYMAGGTEITLSTGKESQYMG